MWGKFSNAGQICIGSDHVILVGSQEREELFLAYAKKAADRYAHGGTMARIVNEAHFERLQGLVEGTQGQIVHGGDFTIEDLRVGITIVKNVETGDVLMGDEIFGPLLPVLRVDTLQQGVDLIRETETPLALYSLSEM
jgi:aldehyde dehydrogenase (NAD+)